jgi:outer membrane protein OmpA-like peptidoglycan-associated protein
MRPLRRLLPLAVLLALAAAGCATPPPPRAAEVPYDTIVLLPPDSPGGATGAVLLKAPGGERRLDRPMSAVSVGSDGAPGPTFDMDERTLREMAGPVLDAMPDPPSRFLLYFSKGTADLLPESEPVFRDALRSILEKGAVDVSVVGHSDTLGDKEYNDRLSLKRAQAVAGRLQGQGVSPSILEVASHGKENPLVATGDQVAEPKNRRVEITVR